VIGFVHYVAGVGELWLFTALHLHTPTHQHPPLEAQLQATLNIIPVQAWYALASGTIAFVNEATASYLRLPQPHHLRYGADVGGTWESHLSYIHPEDHPHARRQWSVCLRKHEVGELQLRIMSEPGSARWFLVRAEPLRASNGELLFWVGVNIDIDDAKRAAEALDIAKERMTRAAEVATIVELSTSISHEVVQPLSAIVANARQRSIGYRVSHQTSIAPKVPLKGFSATEWPSETSCTKCNGCSNGRSRIETQYK
jgi:hypothetical protein